jgi:plasmid maintenance system killer protein
MEISYPSKRMQKLCTREKEMRGKLGTRMAEVLKRQLAVIEGAANLAELWAIPQTRCHEMKGDRKGQISIDLVHPQRLYIRPDHDPVPQQEGGGLDRAAVTRVLIVDIDDPHG